VKTLLLVLLVACGGAQRATVRVDGADVAYEIRGKGPTCVVMPGGPGLSSSYLRSKQLEAHVRAVYVDPLGTGRSGKLAEQEKYSIARDVAMLEAVRRKLGLAKWCVIGHSYGGFVALRYALEHPAQTSGLLLYSTSPSTGPEWQELVGKHLTDFQDQPWYQTAMHGMELETKAKNQAELDVSAKEQLPLYFAEWTTRSEELKRMKILLDYDVSHRRTQEAFDVREQLPALLMPVVIVVGERDFMFGPEVAAWFQPVPKHKVVPIPKAGHFSHVEQPEQFGNAVAALAVELH
jgi:proline iminopeptidase